MARAALRPCQHALVLLIIVLLSALSVFAQSAAPDCNDPVPTTPTTGNLKYVAEIEPSTTWRPMLGEVKFTITGAGFKADNLKACFRWKRTAALLNEKKKSDELADAIGKEKKEAEDKIEALSNEQKTAGASEEKAFEEKMTAARAQLKAAEVKLAAALKQANDAEAARWVRSTLVRVVANDLNKTTFAALVPSDIPYPEKWWQKLTRTGEVEHYGSWSTVPVAEFRILSGSSTPEGEKTDFILPVGITSVHYSLLLAAVFVVLAWGLLYYVGSKCGVPGKGIALKIISTQGGSASVSQFQIVLWTFVIGASAIYVMSLSGSLIDIAGGTLVLLGISGVANLGSKLKEGQTAKPAATDPAPAPAVPGSIDGIVTQAYASEVRLSWRAPATGGPTTTYTVQYRVTANPANNWKIATNSITRPNFTVTGLTPGTPYDFQVAASNAGGSGQPTAANETTAAAAAIPAGAPGQVANLGAVGSPTAATLNLIWGQPGSAPTGYLIEYRIHDSDEFWHSARSTTADAAFTVTGLFPNTLYDFRVTASNGAGSGPSSSMVSAMTGPRTPMWSDLVMSTDRTREIDVTRVQMLFFTLITAIFVGLKVLVSGVIPDIPQGFLLLMGISNGVYLTAKFVPD